MDVVQLYQATLIVISTMSKLTITPMDKPMAAMDKPIVSTRQMELRQFIGMLNQFNMWSAEVGESEFESLLDSITHLVKVISSDSELK